jgi:hypothetical protein
MQFINPIWLWGLTGLLIPIGIHLLSRREGKVIKIGSIRHLEETNSKQFKSIRLNELVLLILRCLLITILVLVLSGFHFQGFEQSGKWLVVENGLERDEQFSALIDSLKQNGFEAKSLSKGFPDLGDSIQSTGKINYWNVLEELKKESLSQAIILTYNYAKGFRGKRVSRPENIQWISKNPGPSEFGLSALQLSNDSLRLRIGHSNAGKTSFSTVRDKINDGQDFFKFQESDSVPIESAKTISIQIVNDPTFAYDSKMIVAVLQAVDDASPAIFNLETLPCHKFPSENKADWVIWLCEEKINPTTSNSISFQSNNSNQLLEKTGYSSWALTQRLNEQIVLDQNLTAQLGLILTSEKKYDEKIRQKDRRALPDKLAWTTTQEGPEFTETLDTTSSKKYLMTLFLFVLLFERWMAFKKNQ